MCLGCATGYDDQDAGFLRPTFTHEFVHSRFAHTGRIGNSQEWLQEGLAVRYQLRFHPQANFSEIVRGGLEQESHRTSLAELCSGQPLASDRYWQATTVVEFRVDSERYVEQSVALIRAMQSSGSTDLGPLLNSLLETSWESFEADWRAFCAKRYAAEQ